jgi:hypothetical protein
MKNKSKIPHVGDDIYMDTMLYLTHGEDDFIGGLCEVLSVEIIDRSIWFRIKENPDFEYCWNAVLMNKQGKLKTKFGNSRGYKEPDLRGEFNEWW